MLEPFWVRFMLSPERESDYALLTIWRRAVDPFLLCLVTPRLDAILPGDGNAQTVLAEITPTTSEFLFLLCFPSPRFTL